MATIKQKKAIDKIIDNHGNVSKAMKDVGYTKATAKNPSNLTDSKGYQQLCSDYGLTDRLLLDSLVTDIKNKIGKRERELALGFKIKGRMVEKVDIEVKQIDGFMYIKPKNSTST